MEEHQESRIHLNTTERLFGRAYYTRGWSSCHTTKGDKTHSLLLNHHKENTLIAAILMLK